MSRSKRILTLLLCILLITGGLNTEAQVAPTVLTLGLLIKSMQGLVKTIKDGAQDLLQAGDVDAAEQQMLLAAIIERTINAIQQAFSKSLDDAYEKLGTQEKNVYDQLKLLGDDARDIEQKTNQDVSDRIFQAQSAANQILDRMPFTDQSPILMGVKVKSFLTSKDQNDADVSVLGYLLADKRMGYKKPDVKIDGKPVPSDNVGAFYDRINIQIPDKIKDDIRFANSPCAPRKTFHVELTVHYLKAWDRLGWPTSETTLPLSSNSLPGGILYDIKVSASADRTFTVPEPVAFSNVSPYVSVDCERTSSTEVSWNMPDEGKQLNGSGRWVETDGVGSESAHAAVSGKTIVASGSINGRNKDWLGNCPGGGHGKLQVYGTYYMDTTHHEPYTYEQSVTMISDKVALSLPAEVALPVSVTADVRSGNFMKSQTIHLLLGIVINVPVPVIAPPVSAPPPDAQALLNATKSALRYQTVVVSIYRKNCNQLLDTLVINVQKDPNEFVPANSKEGFFKASLQKGTLEVQRVKEL